jgi:hypothetical protein
VKRLALLALLLAWSPLVAAPAPVPKPQRKPERPAARQAPAVVLTDGTHDVVVVKLGQLKARQAGRVWARLVEVAQPPSADPPG